MAEAPVPAPKQAKKASKQFRNYVFTLNNPSGNDLPKALEALGATYAVWQLEKGKEGTPHLQGYVCFPQGAKKSIVQLRLVMEAHYETRKGTHAQAKEYCTKVDTRVEGPWTFGEEPQRGKRSDILAFKRALDEGKSEYDISRDDELFPHWVRNHKAIERYKRIGSVTNRSWMTETIILHGEPGSGKSRYAAENYPNAYWLKKPGQGQTVFFDGYDGHEVVVIDEFYGWLPFDLLCRMCDRYPLMVDSKGGHVNFYPKLIIITSNKDPRSWYKQGLGALQRRFSYPHGKITLCNLGWDGRVMFACEETYMVSKQALHKDCNEAKCFVRNPVEQIPEEELHQPIPSPPHLEGYEGIDLPLAKRLAAIIEEDGEQMFPPSGPVDSPPYDGVPLTFYQPNSTLRGSYNGEGNFTYQFK